MPVRRPFGRCPQVSLFTLGTMRALESSRQMYDVVKMASSVGINHIETAPAYGPAETFLGRAIKQVNDEGLGPIGGWIITSKILPGISFKDGKKQLKSILSRLGEARIDNLAIHGLNRNEHLEWSLKGEGNDFLNWAEEEGLIGQVGFSSHGSEALIAQAIESNRFTFCSLHLHLLDPIRIPLAKKALSSGLGVMAISPADKGGHLHSPSKTLIQDCHPIEPIELAYRYLLAQGISTLTIGAKNPIDLKVASKLADKDGALKDDENNSIQQLLKARKERLNNSLCGQCQSCLPCPQNLPIPELLRLRNLTLGHDLITFTKERYNLIGKAGHWWENVDASACHRCGDCLPRCPHHLPIPDLLQETHKLLKSSPKRRLWN